VTLAIVLLGLGLALIVAELMFPSLGVLGLLAALCVVGAVAAAFAESSTLGVRFLVAVALLVPVAIVAGLKLLPHGPLGKTLVARGSSFEDGAAVDRRDAALLGKHGIAESFLRPIGVARFDGRRVDVVTRGEPIEAGTALRVIEVEGNRVVVARDEEEPARAGRTGRGA
jgi:membrane-bound serine protease (ClpP class)